ncbi:MAG TPA: hypothetical protein PKC24_14585, partial [Cyclobacteriaceae bacterium]|nr:hypothetical protein [Cyclobacteriaceae bacterium]
AQPVSFEDLVKEILEAKEPSPAPAPAYTSYEAEPTPAPAYKSYRSDEEIGEIFERSRRDAATSDLQGMTSDLKGRVSELGSKHFMQYEVEETDTAASGILSELKSAGGLKKAVIYSEILNRKHF